MYIFVFLRARALVRTSNTLAALACSGQAIFLKKNYPRSLGLPCGFVRSRGLHQMRKELFLEENGYGASQKILVWLRSLARAAPWNFCTLIQIELHLHHVVAPFPEDHDHPGALRFRSVCVCVFVCVCVCVCCVLYVVCCVLCVGERERERRERENLRAARTDSNVFGALSHLRAPGTDAIHVSGESGSTDTRQSPILSLWSRAAGPPSARESRINSSSNA